MVSEPALEREQLCWIREDHSGDELDWASHMMFIRLVPRGSTEPTDTIDASHASVDVDVDGSVLGVTIFW